MYGAGVVRYICRVVLAQFAPAGCPEYEIGADLLLPRGISAASSEMAEGNKMILEEMNSLQSSTAGMKESMNDMHSGASQITHTGEQLAEISSKLKDSIAVISEQIDLFKV